MKCGEGQGDMKGKMSNMMQGCKPEMMTEMMSHCIGMMLQKMPKEKRKDFILNMVGTLAKEGCAGSSERAKKNRRKRTSPRRRRRK